jgi:hypothetical protein
LQAEKDKKRYQGQMENYVPPEGMDEEEETKGKKVKKKKDPNAPKRGQSNYMFYSSAIRSQVKAENPDASFGQMVS